MKIKEQMQKEQESAFENDLSFQEWLRHYMSEPTDKELDDMEKEFNTKNTLVSKTLFHKFQPSNNTDYHSLQGA